MRLQSPDTFSKSQLQNDAMLLPAGGWRRVFRVGWVLLAILSVFTFSLVLYYTYEFVRNPPSRIAQGLAELGWSSDFYLWFNVFFLIVSYLTYFVVALLIFLLRPQERMALFASVFLLGFGTANAYITAPEFLGIWDTAPTYFVVSYIIFNLLSWPLLVPFFGLFPDGRFIPRWIMLIALYGFLFSVAWGFFPQLFGDPQGFFAVFVAASIILIFGGSLLAQIQRYRHYSNSVQRQQTKWLIYGFSLILLGVVLQVVGNFFLRSNFVSPGATVIYDLLGIIVTLSFSLIPISVGLAILRYRLWDIDVLIRRTLTYGVVTALLIGIYFTTVVVLQRIFALTTGAEQSDIVTVVSTLAIAALFIPLRNRIQALIDRRFYRKKYDAQQVLQEFGETVRDETDLEQLTGRLIQVVDETMQPRSVSVWLKATNDERRMTGQN